MERDERSNETFSQYGKDMGVLGRADPPEGSLKMRHF